MPADSLGIVKRFFPDVERVKDATSDVSVEVLRTDASATSVKNHKDCAMARACRRSLKLDGAIISVSTAFLIKDDTATRYRVPASIAREIIAFDRGATFSPGEYELLKPGRRHEIGARQGSQKGAAIRRQTGRNSKPRHVTTGIRSNLLSMSA